MDPNYGSYAAQLLGSGWHLGQYLSPLANLSELAQCN